MAVRSLAVLPFTALSPEGNDAYLGLGMAETVITKLSALQQLIIRPTSAVRQRTSAPSKSPSRRGGNSASMRCWTGASSGWARVCG